LRRDSIEDTRPEVRLGAGIDGKHITIRPILVPDVAVRYQLKDLSYSLPQMDGIGARNFFLLPLIEEDEGVAGLILLGTGVEGEYRRRGWWQLEKKRSGYEKVLAHRAVLTEQLYMHRDGDKYAIDII